MMGRWANSGPAARISEGVSAAIGPDWPRPALARQTIDNSRPYRTKRLLSTRISTLAPGSQHIASLQVLIQSALRGAVLSLGAVFWLSQAPISPCRGNR